MTPLVIQGSRSAVGAGVAERVFHRPAAPRVAMPHPVWPRQDFAPLARGYRKYNSDPVLDFPLRAELNLYLTTLDDAWFTIENGIDGMVLDCDGWIINETAMFRHAGLSATGRDLSAEVAPVVELDDVFVGNDAAWHNYYHFMLYGVARCHMAWGLVPDSCLLVMPDYATRIHYSQLAYSQDTYEQAFSLSDLAERVTRLPVGLYHARKLRFFWTQPSEPTDILEVPALYRMFEDIKCGLMRDPQAPRRLLLSRSSTSDPRLGSEATALVHLMCAERGFTVIRFEEMALRAQAQAIFNASCIVAPHGAGLANAMFGQSQLRVLELHSDLDGNDSLRACFFQIATEQGQPYMVLNASRGELTAATLARALDICCGG